MLWIEFPIFFRFLSNRGINILLSRYYNASFEFNLLRDSNGLRSLKIEHNKKKARHSKNHSSSHREAAVSGAVLLPLKKKSKKRKIFSLVVASFERNNMPTSKEIVSRRSSKIALEKIRKHFSRGTRRKNSPFASRTLYDSLKIQSQAERLKITSPAPGLARVKGRRTHGRALIVANEIFLSSAMDWARAGARIGRLAVSQEGRNNARWVVWGTTDEGRNLLESNSNSSSQSS